jgi:hypothetical protein
MRVKSSFTSSFSYFLNCVRNAHHILRARLPSLLIQTTFDMKHVELRRYEHTIPTLIYMCLPNVKTWCSGARTVALARFLIPI